MKNLWEYLLCHTYHRNSPFPDIPPNIPNLLFLMEYNHVSMYFGLVILIYCNIIWFYSRDILFQHRTTSDKIFWAEQIVGVYLNLPGLGRHLYMCDWQELRPKLPAVAIMVTLCLMYCTQNKMPLTCIIHYITLCCKALTLLSRLLCIQVNISIHNYYTFYCCDSTIHINYNINRCPRWKRKFIKHIIFIQYNMPHQ